ncbi:homoserine O-acetyltransferase [Piedraia hortae CBS 480.64]|uniref:Homoserine O-acetyltransferase n=1 Tax=Piedraia hortae CBS 480.64 TaxID=1314780 RepID=A0A6A7C5T8_9PEZI|nr:homoserine O-acetyltransferase [Piedraia hortae CBS 480.64]
MPTVSQMNAGQHSTRRIVVCRGSVCAPGWHQLRSLAAAATATAPQQPAQAQDHLPPVAAAKTYRVVASPVLSRPPVLTRDLTSFEKAFFLYQKRLNERLALPFSRYFYYKKGTPSDPEWKRVIKERKTPARDIGVYDAYGKERWHDEVMVGDQTAEPSNIIKSIIRDAEGKSILDTESAKSEGKERDAGQANVQTSLHQMEVQRPLPRVTEADAKNDVRSLSRKLDRTLYLLVKTEDSRWRFPEDRVLGRESLATERILVQSGGINMNTWIVANHPIGHYIGHFNPSRPFDPAKAPQNEISRLAANSQPASEGQREEHGEKVFFMKARILAGQADLSANQLGATDLQWLTKEEIAQRVKPGYWASVRNMLPERAVASALRAAPKVRRAINPTWRLLLSRSRRYATQQSNPQLAFPCLDNIEERTQKLSSRSMSGPEPSYTTGAHETFHSDQPLLLDWGGVLPEFDLAFETWGSLNADKSNAILLHTGLSASSHAKSTQTNPKPGWWEKFIGPGAPLDTDKFFVICTNVLGGCYGSTGPSSKDPLSGRPYATSFPILTLQDMVRAQFRLLDGLNINKLYASVGCSMGGMQSLAAGVLYPDRVSRIVSVSGCARSHPYSIAMRHTQRQVLMADPAWSQTRGSYYAHMPPHQGMKLAREIATITYRSGPEWENRFGRQRADSSKPPALCPDFLIETYLDHAGEKWCLEYDANSLLYVSKAMDLFDLGKELQDATAQRRQNHSEKPQESVDAAQCGLVLPAKPYQEKSNSTAADKMMAKDDLVKGMANLQKTPTLVLGVASDILFPAFQQREIAEVLRETGNRQVTHVELGEDRSLFGHDTFLLDLEGVGGEISRFLA